MDILLDKKEEGYLIGLFIGDGYAHHDSKNRHYNVDFYLNSINDLDIVSYLKNLLNKQKLHFSIFQDKRFNSRRIRVSSKEFMNFLVEKDENLFVKNYGGDYILGFISGFIDAEGYVNNGEVVVTQKDKKILKLVNEYCKKVGIPTRKFWSFIDSRTGEEIWRLRISTKIKESNHNSCKLKRA